MRVKWIAASLALSLLLLLTPSAPPAQSQAPGPILVGWMAPLTGPLAGLAEFYTAGAQLAFEAVGYQVAGRQIRWIQEDTEAKPDVGLTKARKLIERDRVHMLLGVISTSVALAMRQYMLDKGTPWIITEASGSVFETMPGSNVFRVSPDERGYMHPDALRYIANRLGYRRLIVVGMDYSAGAGPFSFDERQNAITSLYIREVRRVDGRIQNVTLEAIPGVKTPY